MKTMIVFLDQGIVYSDVSEEGAAETAIPLAKLETDGETSQVRVTVFNADALNNVELSDISEAVSFCLRYLLVSLSRERAMAKCRINLRNTLPYNAVAQVYFATDFSGYTLLTELVEKAVPQVLADLGFSQ